LARPHAPALPARPRLHHLAAPSSTQLGSQAWDLVVVGQHQLLRQHGADHLRRPEGLPLQRQSLALQAMGAAPQQPCSDLPHPPLVSRRRVLVPRRQRFLQLRHSEQPRLLSERGHLHLRSGTRRADLLSALVPPLQHLLLGLLLHLPLARPLPSGSHRRQASRARLLPLDRRLPLVVVGCPSEVHQRLVPRQLHQLLPLVLPPLQPSVSRQHLGSHLLLVSPPPSASPASQRHRAAQPLSQVAQHLVAVAHRPTLVALGHWQLTLVVALGRWQPTLVVASGLWQLQLPRQAALEPRHPTSRRLEVSSGSKPAC